MTTRRITVLCALVLAGASVAGADQLEKGDVEVAFRFSYSDLDFDHPGGSSESEELLVAIGYMLTDHHEVGAGVAYVGVGSSDSWEYGAGYTYNFRAGQGLNPYVAARILGFGNALADLFDYGWSAELGVKFYPGAHGGVLFGVSYRQLAGADNAPDATNVIAFGGLTLKF